VTTNRPGSLPGLEVYLRGDQVAAARRGARRPGPISAATGATPPQATAGQRPIITDAASPNGKRMLLFDGVDDQMSAVMPALPTGIPNTDGYTV